MGTFTASLRAIGDVKSLPAVVQLDEGRLIIASGDIEIGNWPLSEIDLEPIPTGYRIAAEGDQILIELTDLDSFNAALSELRKRKFRKANKGTLAAARSEPVSTEPHRAPVATEPVAANPARTVPLPPRTNQPVQPAGWTSRGLAFVDGTLAKASKRLGPYLPEWIFTRVMFAIAFVALILMIIVPVLVSTFLLISGGLIIVFGAIVYSDPMLASRWLPGRTTPPHVLLFGVIILMLGVLLGVVAS
jgi:hypothetical protein